MLIRNIFFAVAITVTAPAWAQTDADREEITRLASLWHGGATAEQVEAMLSVDFVRPMPDGSIWTKDRQVAWLQGRSSPPGITNRFDQFELRFHGDTAIVTGAVALVGDNGAILDKTIFTDTYVKSGGQWRLAAAHRSQIRPPAQ